MKNHIEWYVNLLTKPRRSYYLDFNHQDLTKARQTLRLCWEEFRTILVYGPRCASICNLPFLSVFSQMFEYDSNRELYTTALSNFADRILGRGTILKQGETFSPDRLQPKSEFMNAHNRFSPPHVEYLYVGLAQTEHACKELVQKECRTKPGNRFGFITFSIPKHSRDVLLVDLTATGDRTITEKENHLKFIWDFVPASSEHNIDILVTELARFMLSAAMEWIDQDLFNLVESISLDTKAFEYAPFQRMARYFSELGYQGIVYRSTVSNAGKNLVLFDKNLLNQQTENISEWTTT